jgi:hypothetical protein
MAVDVAVAVVAEVTKDEETVEGAITKAPEMGAGVEGNHQRHRRIAIAIAIVITDSRAEAGNPIRTIKRPISPTPIIKRCKIA